MVALSFSAIRQINSEQQSEYYNPVIKVNSLSAFLQQRLVCLRFGERDSNAWLLRCKERGSGFTNKKSDRAHYISIERL